MIKEDTIHSWLSDKGYTDAECKEVIERLQRTEGFSEPTSGRCFWELNLRVSPFNGFSGVYTQDVIERIDTKIRHTLDEQIGYLSDKGHRNYEIVREDFTK